ncbi:MULTISPECIES: site-2 protease family protein [Desulfitobacterium]|uniref:Zn-dependent protease n=1 Tax=Desulfitobacterium dehalogenans (strain ATCC 51507 / DSM 9161 / JW/IU-DC1) TaxID=756499 RepID=I4AB34_DESDJ|nr:MULTISPECIES: site-2 protease family protein [Desulfitobacterium]AFM01169.1 Zn-dependent protease [Desulfitobacterium dehalogenans ATCC 51507]
MFNLTTIIANIPALLVGFAFHEYAHAWVADRLGDPTPRSQGRLTLNPFVHLDIFGTLMAVLYSFGWAKPVMTQPHYFKGNKERGRVLVSIAGPLANLLAAFIAMILWIITLTFMKDSSWTNTVSTIFMSMVFMNLGLGVFNILPIPPLDGFSILRGVVPGRYSKVLNTLETYGMFILVIILFTNFLGVVLRPAVSGLYVLYRDTALFLLSPFIS